MLNSSRSAAIDLDPVPSANLNSFSLMVQTKQLPTIFAIVGIATSIGFMIYYHLMARKYHTTDSLQRKFLEMSVKYRDIYHPQMESIRQVKISPVEEKKAEEWHELISGPAPFFSDLVPRSHTGAYILEITGADGKKYQINTADFVKIPDTIERTFNKNSIKPFCAHLSACDQLADPRFCVEQCISACLDRGQCTHTLKLVDLCFLIHGNNDETPEAKYWSLNGTHSGEDAKHALKQHWSFCQGVGRMADVLGLPHFHPGVYIANYDRFVVTVRHGFDPGFYFFGVVSPALGVKNVEDLPGVYMDKLELWLAGSAILLTVSCLYIVLRRIPRSDKRDHDYVPIADDEQAMVTPLTPISPNIKLRTTY